MSKSLFSCLLVCVLWAAAPAQAAFDAFLKLDGVEGESTVAGHANEIVIDSFSMAVTRPGSAGGPNFSDISFSKALDKASPLLMLRCASGTHIPNAVLTLRETGLPKPVPFYVIRLTDVVVTQVSVGGSAGASKPTETFSLNYATIEWDYTQLTPTGGTADRETTRWNLKEPAQ